MSGNAKQTKGRDIKRYKLDASVSYDGGPFVIPSGTEVVVASKHDAALRAAKVEGIMEGMRETKWGIELVKDEQVRDALLRWVDAKIDVVEAKLKADELDARAAQIEEGGVMVDRPTKEDRDALRLLLQREDLSDWDAEFVDNLRNWQGNWTPKQAYKFDDIWAKYY